MWDIFDREMSNPDPNSIGSEKWAVAEKTASFVVCCVHPTLDSEERRRDVIDYVQRLIRSSLGCEVFPYGSVPLKTYLPDGDIDLTAISLEAEESLARKVLAVLQAEEKNVNAEYKVKDTQFIDAEVKLVKCLVRNIVVDISFNQRGGLGTLCFLEQVDRLLGKEHLFKRSIILVKSWCYYESRILGAHHGLISTYALETLVLYIFQFFGSSLNGPLEVLYRFLDYFSRFDWDNYCISLNGPVRKSSLPAIVVEKPENGGNGSFLSKEFLEECVQMFVPRGHEAKFRAFPAKHLNVIDPLKENNNLGRSVHRGNFYRICSAFKYGARNLGRILSLPRESISVEVKNFFSNTLERHDYNDRLDILSFNLSFLYKDLCTLSISSHAENFSDGDAYSKISNGGFEADMSGVDDKCNSGSTEGSYSTSTSPSPQNAYETSEYSPRSSRFGSSRSGRDYYYAPHLFPSTPSPDASLESGSLSLNKSFDYVDGKIGLDTWMDLEDNHVYIANHCHVSSTDSTMSSQDENVVDSLSFDFRERDPTHCDDETETLNPLADLSGDYDSHVRSLVYSPPPLTAYVISTIPPPPSQVRKKPWETVRRCMPLKRQSCSQVNANGMVVGAPFYYHSANKSEPSGTAFGWDNKQRVRGTGTYIPSLKCYRRERQPNGRGRNGIAGINGHSHSGHSNGPIRTNSFTDNHDVQRPQSLAQSHGTSDKTSREPHQPMQAITQHSLQDSSAASVFLKSKRTLEFGSFAHVDTSFSSLIAINGGSADCEKQDRVVEKAFHLKNEAEFPPLTA